MDPKTYEPNASLSRLVGQRMYSVEFVLNDFVQFRFDGSPSVGNPVTFSCYVWPVVEFDGRRWREIEDGYADALRRLTPGTVISTEEQTGSGLRIALDTGVLVIHPGSPMDGVAPRGRELRGRDLKRGVEAFCIGVHQAVPSRLCP